MQKKDTAMTQKMFLKIAIIIVLGGLFGGCSTAPFSKQAGDQPNFIIIFADDLGYGDLGCYGHPTIKTPNLDRMAQEGMKLTQFYSSASECSPSRAGLLTGRLQKRTSVNNVLFPHHKNGLPQTEMTFAAVLKRKDYSTACIGKWHVGHTKPHLPTLHGFDSYFGIPYSNDMTVDPEMEVADDAVFRKGMSVAAMRSETPKKGWVPLFRDEQIVEYPADQTTLTKRYTDEAVGFIQQNRDRPFLLYLAHTMPHIPLFASDAFADTSLRGLYGDTIEEIDASVGRILDALKRRRIDHKTLVIFTSDNGPWLSVKLRGGSAGLLKGGKFTTWEGGFREPCIVWQPGVVPANTVHMAAASTLDIFPTILDMAGIEMPADRVFDGCSLKEMLTKQADSPRESMFYYHGKTLRAVRWKHWKLHLEIAKSELGGGYKKPEQPLLFNLEYDPGEQYNIAGEHPEIVQTIQEVVHEHEKTMNTGP